MNANRLVVRVVAILYLAIGLGGLGWTFWASDLSILKNIGPLGGYGAWLLIGLGLWREVWYARAMALWMSGLCLGASVLGVFFLLNTNKSLSQLSGLLAVVGCFFVFGLVQMVVLTLPGVKALFKKA